MAKSKSKKTKTTKKTTGNGRIPDDATIKFLVKGNARRPGTQAHARYSLYRTGQSVADYIKAGGSRGNIRADIKRGNLALEMPNAKSGA